MTALGDCRLPARAWPPAGSSIAARSKDPILIPLFSNKFYFDELYAALIAGTQDLLASWPRFVRSMDPRRRSCPRAQRRGLGHWFRRCAFFQFGNLQAYAFLFGVGVVGMIYLLVFR